MKMEAIEKFDFEHWLALWTKTIEENFEGEMAETAKIKAGNIANLMADKIEVARR